jgi:hypothetical protein
VEVLLEKVRYVYDKLVLLDTLIIPLEVEEPSAYEPEPERPETGEPVHEHIPEPVIEQPAVEPEKQAPEPQPVIHEGEEELVTNESEEIVLIQEEVKEETVVEEPVVEEPVMEAPEPPVQPEMPAEPPEERTERVVEETEKEEETAPSMDLFSTTEPTIGDKYSEQQKMTVADKIHQEGINELREAIGINEKFLFINELFNGDMSKYNKVIDELDEFPTLKGAETYLLELKVQYQWQGDNPAYLKLLELAKRKFGE